LKRDPDEKFFIHAGHWPADKRRPNALIPVDWDLDIGENLEQFHELVNARFDRRLTLRSDDKAQFDFTFVEIETEVLENPSTCSQQLRFADLDKPSCLQLAYIQRRCGELQGSFRRRRLTSS
jgi:hypothetical protein